jgi:hypothetical protein
MSKAYSKFQTPGVAAFADAMLLKIQVVASEMTPALGSYELHEGWIRGMDRRYRRQDLHSEEQAANDARKPDPA